MSTEQPRGPVIRVPDLAILACAAGMSAEDVAAALAELEAAGYIDPANSITGRDLAYRITIPGDRDE